jgi:hypothetical protein
MGVSDILCKPLLHLSTFTHPVAKINHQLGVYHGPIPVAGTSSLKNGPAIMRVFWASRNDDLDAVHVNPWAILSRLKSNEHPGQVVEGKSDAGS